MVLEYHGTQVPWYLSTMVPLYSSISTTGMVLEYQSTRVPLLSELVTLYAKGLHVGYNTSTAHVISHMDMCAVASTTDGDRF